VAVAKALREAIGSGAVPAGAALRQDQIAAHFDVSHIPVREALKQLVAEGLAVLVHNKGVVVSELSVKEALELTEYRSLLEGQLARWAAGNLNESDFAQAESILVDLDRAQNVNDILRLNAEFHTILYRGAQRPFFLRSVDRVRVNLGRYWRLAWMEFDHKPRSQNEHRCILDLCRDGSVDEVGDLVEHHIRATGTLIVDYLKQQATERDLAK
jgi:DNA-binding GntR family transcriptional regulator